MVRRINALGRSVQFVYDHAHRLERLINENGEAYGFRYDRNDNVVEETTRPGATTGSLPPAPVGKAMWDANCQLVSMTDPLGAIMRFDYDDAGRLTATLMLSIRSKNCLAPDV